MTKIAYILKMYPRFSETFILNEILELERQGVDIRIYSLRKPDDGRFHAHLARVKANVVYAPQYPEMEPERVQAAHQSLYRLNPAQYMALRQHAESLPQPYGLKRFLQAGVVAAHLLQHPVDALHAHFASSATRVANLVWQLIGVPYSFTAHAKDIFHEEVNPNSLRGKIRDAHFVVTVSRFNQAYLQQLAAGQPADVRCLYNGIDLSQFTPAAATRRSNLILSIGRLVEKKGFDQLILACALLRDWGIDFCCEIIGKGEQQGVLRQLIADLELDGQVDLIGPRPQDQVVAAYQRAALFALPCLVAADGNRDGLPTVLLEAMASGLPVISTNVTGNPEIVDQGINGLLVEPNDPLALAEGLARLLRAAELRTQWGAAARQKAERCFDVRHNVAQLRHWLAEPVAARPAPANGMVIPADLPHLGPPAAPRLEEVFA